MPALLLMIHSLGKWRYLLTGAALAAALGAVCHAVSALTAPFAAWRHFTATVTAVSAGAAAVRFTDHHGLSHTAALPLPQGCTPAPGDPLAIAIPRELFAAGSYTADLSAPDARILTRPAKRLRLLKALSLVLLRELLVCGALLTLFVLAMRLLFPAA